MEIVLTIEFDIAVRFAKGVFRYAFIAAVVAHHNGTYHELHMHFVNIFREGQHVLLPCNLTIRYKNFRHFVIHVEINIPSQNYREEC